MDQRYEFDAATGNLKSRKDALRNRTELFEYDALQRLILYAGKKVEYTPDGNIIRKGDAGEMVYTNPNRPYAVTGNTPEKEACIHSGLQVEYTAADRPAWIEEGNRRAEFTYNALFDRVRVKMNEEGKTVDTRYYLGGNYEAHCDSSGTEERLYVGGDCYEAPAILVKKEGKTDIRFLHRDYLGSILQVADNKGNIIEENSFDAWGSRRNPDTQEIYTGTEAPNLMTGRGFTGHEHLDGFGLIHMNARLYDPILGRFLSPDPYVQLPDFTQAMNRYGYCMNRPLCYVDENGEFFWIVVGIAAGVTAITNVAIHWNEITAAGGWKGFWKGAGYALAGGVAGGVGAAVGIGAAVGFGAAAGVTGAQLAAATTGILPGATVGAYSSATSGFLLNTSNSLIEGKNFGDALMRGFDGAVTGFISGGIMGGITGGVQALSQGKNIWTGGNIKNGGAPRPIYDAETVTQKSEKPMQNHHFATNKNKRFTPEMEKITNKYGLKLDESWNKEMLPHLGRHPNAYHEWVLEQMKQIDAMPYMNQQNFIKQFNIKVIQPVKNNPEMLYKSFWQKK